MLCCCSIVSFSGAEVIKISPNLSKFFQLACSFVPSWVNSGRVDLVVFNQCLSWNAAWKKAIYLSRARTCHSCLIIASCHRVHLLVGVGCAKSTMKNLAKRRPHRTEKHSMTTTGRPYSYPAFTDTWTSASNTFWRARGKSPSIEDLGLCILYEYGLQCKDGQEPLFIHTLFITKPVVKISNLAAVFAPFLRGQAARSVSTYAFHIFIFSHQINKSRKRSKGKQHDDRPTT